MVDNNKIPIEVKKPTETVYELREVQLPKLSEITDKDGRVKLPPELIEKLRDPNARFRVDLVVCPVGIEEGNYLWVPCMATGCKNETASYGIHANCPRYEECIKAIPVPILYSIQWSTHARLKCLACKEVSDISKGSFSCHGSGCTNTTTDLLTLTDAALLALDNKSISKEFTELFLKNAREMYRKK